MDERESLWDIIDNIQGLLIADKDLIGEDFQEQIREHTMVNLQTPTRSNMTDRRGKDCNRWITSTRRLVEKVRARDLWHLTSRITRKILAHTVGVWINKISGFPPLQFERQGIA